MIVELAETSCATPMASIALSEHNKMGSLFKAGKADRKTKFSSQLDKSRSENKS